MRTRGSCRRRTTTACASPRTCPSRPRRTPGCPARSRRRTARGSRTCPRSARARAWPSARRRRAACRGSSASWSAGATAPLRSTVRSQVRWRYRAPRRRPPWRGNHVFSSLVLPVRRRSAGCRRKWRWRRPHARGAAASHAAQSSCSRCGPRGGNRIGARSRRRNRNGARRTAAAGGRLAVSRPSRARRAPAPPSAACPLHLACERVRRTRDDVEALRDELIAHVPFAEDGDDLGVQARRDVLGRCRSASSAALRAW